MEYFIEWINGSMGGPRVERKELTAKEAVALAKDSNVKSITVVPKVKQYNI